MKMAGLVQVSVVDEKMEMAHQMIEKVPRGSFSASYEMLRQMDLVMDHEQPAQCQEYQVESHQIVSILYWHHQNSIHQKIEEIKAR